MPGGAFVGSATLCWDTIYPPPLFEPICVPVAHTVISGSANVFTNSSSSAFVSSMTSHPCSVISGSSTVFINGSPAARIGDSLSCFCSDRGRIVTGSLNVIIGG